MPLNESVKKVFKYVIDFGEEVDRSLVDGWQWKDALNFLDEALAAPAAAKELKAAAAALKAGLTPEDKQELILFIKSEFDISNDDAENKVEGTILWLGHTEDFIRLFKKKKPPVV